MKKTIIYTLMVTAGLLSCSALQAQYKHEFSLYGGGGLSTLKYDITTGEQKNGLGGTAGLGYTFFFSPKWGLETGAGLSFYNAKYNLNNLSTKHMTTDMDGAAFEFRSTVSNYEEKQKAMMVQIPLMLQFQTGNKHQFYAALGGKVAIPVNGTYNSSGATIQNSGYYAAEDYEYTTQEFMGFGSFTGKDGDGDLRFKTAFLASAEAGVKWKLKDGLSLYTGAYLDYGLNNIYKGENNSQFVAYNTANPKDLTVNSVMNSQYTQNGTAHPFTDKVLPMAVGLKVRLAFGKGSTVKTSAYVPPVQTDNSTGEARRKADEDAKQKAAAEAQARQQAEAGRLAKEQQKAQQLAAEKAAQAEAIKQQAIKTDIGQPVENYSLSQTELTSIQRQELDEKIELLRQNPNLKFYIYGHTYNIGNEETNERVRLQRAEKAREYLLSKGIAENRILGIASKRDTQPVAPNTNEENRMKNRRVEITVQ
jgi:outer membrane protein OmpA-like peptidoglycan-associated protein